MAKLKGNQKLKRWAANLLGSWTGQFGDLESRTLGPYVRNNSTWYSDLLSSGGLGLIGGEIGEYDQAGALRDAIGSRLSGESLNYWNSLSNPEKDTLLEQYYTEDDNGLYNLWGLAGTTDTFDTDSFLDDISAFDKVGARPIRERFYDIDSILADSQAAIDAENERLLASLNEDLQRTGDAYTQTRNNILTQQHQRNAQTMDTLASDMERSRRNAIEAGASAGIRIAGNVNAILSAQNKMSQQSLETSNQLAQMLLNKRNAEAGLRSQWRDIEQSTYDRVQNRANSEISWGQAKYDEAMSDWQDRFDASVPETNGMQDRIRKYKTNAAYKAPSGSDY